jgi:Domain of unknown function (DUF6602)
METSFRSVEFLKDLAQELIDSFSRAGRATTPGLVGTAREQAVRQKLEAILPPAAGVGSGCVIDSTGHTSKQQDIVLFEKQLCPVFSINQTPETTYYPCEGVMAVGEVKSGLDRRGLEDSFVKIRSAKQLERYNPNPSSWRKYGSPLVAAGAPSEIYDPINKPMDQIYGFVLCNHLELEPKTFLSAYKELCLAEKPELCPNLIISLRDGCVVFLSTPGNEVRIARSFGSGVALTTLPNGNFQYLLTHLNWIIVRGRTVESLPFQRYVLEGDGRMQILNYLPFVDSA